MQNQELLRLPNAETLARVREKERENRFGWLRYPILRGQIPPPPLLDFIRRYPQIDPKIIIAQPHFPE